MNGLSMFILGCVVTIIVAINGYLNTEAVKKEIHDVCGQCEPAECVETQGFGPVDAVDGARAVSSAVDRLSELPLIAKESEAWQIMLGRMRKCMEIGGALLAPGNVVLCVVSPAAEGSTFKPEDCVKVGGTFIGQTNNRNNSLCDFSNVK